MTSLLERHGQGGVCDQTTGESYFSSFLIADPRGGWVLETSGRSWVAAPIEGDAAISNRLTLGRDWTRASSDVPAGADWDEWRHPRAPTGHADVRLAASRACLATSGRHHAGRMLAAHLRDHGGEPASPRSSTETGAGVTVCMHLRGFQNTTSAMVAELPADPERPLRAWVAPGQPCVSVFVPVFPPHVPLALGDEATWQGFASLRDRVEADPAHWRRSARCSRRWRRSCGRRRMRSPRSRRSTLRSWKMRGGRLRGRWNGSASRRHDHATVAFARVMVR